MSKIRVLLIVSFLLSLAAVWWGGLAEQESNEIVNLVVTLSATMAGFGLVAFQIAHASSELRNDFIESSIL